MGYLDLDGRDEARSKEPSHLGLGFSPKVDTAYGVIDWMAWLPCGMQVIAVGLGPLG